MVNVGVNKEAIGVEVKNLEKLMTSNPEAFKRLQEVIRQDLWTARNSVVRNLIGIFENGDPMEARRAVRSIVYKSLLGGNINILNMRAGTASWKVRQKTRKVEQNPGMRGGNRIKRTGATARMEGYEGKARGFILRFVNSGTSERKSKYGSRGAIAPRNFFEPTATAALSVVADHIAQMVEQEVKKMMEEKNN